MMKVMVMLLLAPAVTIMLSTVSVHAVDKMVPSSLLAKVAQREQKFRHILTLPTLAVQQQNRFLQNFTSTSPTPAPLSGQCAFLTSETTFKNTTCMCEEGMFHALIDLRYTGELT